MKKTIRLTESELIHLVHRIIKEQEGFDKLDDTPIEDEPSLDDLENFDDEIEDFTYDTEDDIDDYDDFQTKMRVRERMKNDRPSNIGLGAGTRWDSESEKDWSPIKPSDMPLDKFLKSKYNNR
jgi:hypothetical protein